MSNNTNTTIIDNLNLTHTQREAVSLIADDGATASDIADALGYKNTSGAYDIVRRARHRGAPIVCRNGTYLLVDSEDVDDSVEPMIAMADGSAASRPPTPPRRLVTKQEITRTANEFLADLEDAIQGVLVESQPVESDTHAISGGQDLVMFRTDDHFGEVSKKLLADNRVVETFNTQVATERVLEHWHETLAVRSEKMKCGVVFDTFHLILNGDIVTNEAIFPSQPWGVESTIRKQLQDAFKVYFGIIKDASELFPAVQVVCQGGNHGEFRVKGSSDEANADDILYDMLEAALDAGGFSNVNFISNTFTPETMFWFRRGAAKTFGKWMGYTRHGQDSLGHIGTNSAKQRWDSWLLGTAEVDPRPYGRGFDVAFTGHYHQLKMEPIAGRPVLMGGSLSPAGDYENRLGIEPGRPGAWTFGVSDDEPVAWLHPVYFDPVEF